MAGGLLPVGHDRALDLDLDRGQVQEGEYQQERPLGEDMCLRTVEWAVVQERKASWRVATWGQAVREWRRDVS